MYSISHTGQPILLKVIAEEVRRNPEEPPSQSTTIQLAFIPPGPISNYSAVFGATEYIALLDENSTPGTVLELAQANINVNPGETLMLELQNNNGSNLNLIQDNIVIISFYLPRRYFCNNAVFC